MKQNNHPLKVCNTSLFFLLLKAKLCKKLWTIKNKYIYIYIYMLGNFVTDDDIVHWLGVVVCDLSSSAYIVPNSNMVYKLYLQIKLITTMLIKKKNSDHKHLTYHAKFKTMKTINIKEKKIKSRYDNNNKQ